MDVKDLRYVAAVYEAGSFSGATRSLRTVTSNVSLRIRNLEARIKGQLFERGHRNIKPTSKGERAYMHATRVIPLMEEAERDLQRPDAP